jgi:hypothetical protein
VSAATPPVAIALVVNGQHSWMGSTMTDQDGCLENCFGVYRVLVAAFGRLDLPRTLPAGSELAVISYADDVVTRWPLGPATAITGSLFGSERDYVYEIGADSVRGIHTGLDVLSHSRAAKKYLVVLGDGTVMRPDDAARDLGRLRRDADMLDVEIAVFIMKSPLSAPHSPLLEIADREYRYISEDTIVDGIQTMLAKP